MQVVLEGFTQPSTQSLKSYITQTLTYPQMQKHLRMILDVQHHYFKISWTIYVFIPQLLHSLSWKNIYI